MANFNQHLVIKSSHGNLEVRITTNENSVRIQGKTDQTSVDKSFLLDDPDLGTKIGNLWQAIKSEIDSQLTNYLSGIEQAWVDFNQNQ